MESTTLYRWESSSGLEHTCWQCHLKSNNPKARQHCYGIHNIPCIRYHSTMFAIGRAHDCAACVTADEVHDGRHREIAILIKEYLELASVTDTAPTASRKKGLRLPFQVVNNQGDGQRLVAPHDSDDAETLSSTSVDKENYHETATKAEQRAFKKAIKHDRSLKKSARNSERHAICIHESDIERVTSALHGGSADTRSGSGHPLASDKDIEEVMERNRRFVANINEHKSHLRKTVAAARRATEGQRKKHRGKSPELDAASNEEDYEELVNAVLLQLGIDATGNLSKRPDRRESFCSTPPAKMVAVMAKLRSAVREDIEKHENEQKQTCIRAGGFWRYCGRPVFERMTEIARSIDWRTGRIIKDSRENAEGERARQG